MKLQLFVDPSCPFTWVTASWLRSAAPALDATYILRPLSLAIVNADNPDVPEQYRQQQIAGRRVLRVMEAARRQAGDAAADRVYVEAGARFHRDGDATFAGLADAVAAAGVPADVIAAADDDEFDAPLVEALAEVRGYLDGDAASPVLHFEEHERAFWGPVLGEAPRGEAAGDLLAALETLARTPRFAQLKAPLGGDVTID